MNSMCMSTCVHASESKSKAIIDARPKMSTKMLGNKRKPKDGYLAFREEC